MFNDLYTTDVLSLSATLKNTSLENPQGQARKVSKLCGSWLEIELNLKGTGSQAVVSESAVRLQACALGQASAAILQDNIVGATWSDIIDARKRLWAMLKSDGPVPRGRFARLAVLEGVKAYPPRHTSTLLAFDAAVEAFEKAQENA